ncbi:MAG: phosphoribosylamine--glycine ligase [Deltaproteobacteria bacterium]|nr:phosphoribosylamine--glycine ligase [Deltaproteobacteria bacterium]
MRILLVGSGGREAALAWRIARSPSLTELVVAGGNPGWPSGVRRIHAETPAEVVAAAGELRSDLVVVGPEDPLAHGLADRLIAASIPCFGPVRAAARLEASKAFAKEVMAAAGVPTAGALVVDGTDPGSVTAAEERCAQGQVVVKVDGLAAGKGVFVCPTAEEAMAALDEAWSGRFGDAAACLVLEDLLVGPEVSVFALCDGERVVALPSSQDHKRLMDGDAGPNTGGMGAYVPCPLVPLPEAERLVEAIHAPVVRELAHRGTPYRGLLYAGLMITNAGPQVLEFNVRFGDPECQPLMCLWQDDILPWLYGAATGALPKGSPRFSDGAACCVVMASAGYPASSTKGVRIPEPPLEEDLVVFFAGAARDESGTLVTAGGRVLGVTGLGPDLAAAREQAYAGVERWQFPGAQVRSDIALGGLP